MNLTDEQIHALSGRELDAAVAEQVLGWRRVASKDWKYPPSVAYVVACCMTKWDWRHPTGKRMCSNDSAHGWIPPRCSTDIAAAWQVVLKLRADGWFYTLHDMPDGTHAARFDNQNAPDVTAMAPTVEIAICKAALKAMRLQESAE